MIRENLVEIPKIVLSVTNEYYLPWISKKCTVSQINCLTVYMVHIEFVL